MQHSISYQKVKKILEQTISHEQIVVVWVSWGADSMYLLFCIQTRRKENKRQPTYLHILSCNHNTRENTINEINTVKDFSTTHTFFTTSYLGTVFTEEKLRMRRHKEFIEYCNTNNSNILLLWHHFNDRIETTFLNIRRGCNTQWLLWLETTKSHFLNSNITIVRPLLWLSKSNIIQECWDLKIPYHNDPSNYDITYSQRNIMRHTINEIFNTKWFYNSMKYFYSTIEKDAKKNEIFKKNNNIKKEWEFEFIYNTDWSILSNIKKWNRSPEILYNIYKLLWITINPRSNTLENLSKNLNKKSWSSISYNNITIKSFNYASIIILNE